MVTTVPTRATTPGFTLIELLIVLAIVGMMSVFALPAMRDLVVTNRMKTLSLDLYTSLALARSEAIKRNTGSVSMIAATVGGVQSWQNGWTVTCVDTAGSCGGSNVVVLAADAVDATIALAAVIPGTTTPVTSVTFARDGRLATTSPATSFRVTYTANNAKVPMRCVELSVSGRPKTLADTNGADADGCN